MLIVNSPLARTSSLAPALSFSIVAFHWVIYQGFSFVEVYNKGRCHKGDKSRESDDVMESGEPSSKIKEGLAKQLITKPRKPQFSLRFRV